ncbi:unnamed protein product [Strongylus vulgaris]|uniref:Uncharacterized protein n=1 Tax=Strongylus vulgaris TaxID=40348 RepID=A0A3P7JTA5_STRVU|nr:unnamed protein product [Strongylus vulgaris]
MVCSQLMYIDRKYSSVLPSQEDLLSLLEVQGDVVAKYGLFTEIADNTHQQLPSTEEELFHFMENAARKAVIYLTIDSEDKAHNISLAYAAVVVPVINLLYETRWECTPRSDSEDKDIAWYWASSSDCSGMKLEAVDRWTSRFHAETPLEFLAHIHEYIQKNSPEWQDTMFNGRCAFFELYPFLIGGFEYVRYSNVHIL